MDDRLTAIEQDHNQFRVVFAASEKAANSLVVSEIDSMRSTLYQQAVVLEYVAHCVESDTGDNKHSASAHARQTRIAILDQSIGQEAEILDQWMEQALKRSGSPASNASPKLVDLLKLEKLAISQACAQQSFTAEQEATIREYFAEHKPLAANVIAASGDTALFLAELNRLQQKLSALVTANQQLSNHVGSAAANGGGGRKSGHHQHRGSISAVVDGFLVTPFMFVVMMAVMLLVALICMTVVGPHIASYNGNSAGLITDYLLACPPAPAPGAPAGSD